MSTPESHQNDPGPRGLSRIIGQAQAVRQLKALAELSLAKRPVHLLLIGPAGSGKRTLASSFADELGTTLVTTKSPAMRGSDMMGILTNLAERDVMFIDEIDHLARPLEDLLEPALKDFTAYFVIDKGLQARTL